MSNNIKTFSKVALAVLLVVALMLVLVAQCCITTPIQAYAEQDGVIYVADEEQLSDALTTAIGTELEPAVIVVTTDITLTATIIITSTTEANYMTLMGSTGTETISVLDDYCTSDTFMISINDSTSGYHTKLTLDNITIDGNDTARLFNVSQAASQEVNATSLIMEEGVVLQNGIVRTNSGPAVYTSNSAGFVMNGGVIQGMQTTNSGKNGAISSFSNAYFELNGGLITDNTCAGYGYAVFANSGIVILGGVEITNNTTTNTGTTVRAAVWLGQNTQCYSNGETNIHDNIATSGYSNCDIYFQSTANTDTILYPRMYLTGAIQNELYIRVSYDTANKTDQSLHYDIVVGADGYEITEQDFAMITYSQSLTALNYSQEDNKIYATDAFAITYSSGIDGADTVSDTVAFSDDTTTSYVLSCDELNRDGYVITSWVLSNANSNVISNGTYDNGATVSFGNDSYNNKSAMTFTAVYTCITPVQATIGSDSTLLQNGTAPVLDATTVVEYGTISYQWYSCISNSTTGGSIIEGATNATYQPSVDTAGTTYYYCIVTNTMADDDLSTSYTQSTTSTIVFVNVVEQYTIELEDGLEGDNSAVYTDINYNVGTLPDTEYQHSYIVGWYLEDSYTTLVTDTTTFDSSTTIYAKWTAILYTITFDVDGELTTQSLAYGETPTAVDSPSKASTAEYTYTFTGWDNTIVDVEGNTIYTAVFSAVKNSYTITFVVEGQENTVLSVEYGATPSYGESNPSKADTAEYTYAFAGWDNSVVEVVGNATYTAVFTATAIETEDTFNHLVWIIPVASVVLVGGVAAIIFIKKKQYFIV